jgi:hypothetical protein
MPLNSYTLILSQRDAGNTTFEEKLLSGSRLIIQTDSTGNIVASGSIDAAPIGQNIAAAGSFTTLSANGLSSLTTVSASAVNLIGNLSLASANPNLTSTSGGNLTISSTGNSSVYVNNVQFSGSGIVVPGNLTVQGTMTYISSSVVDIGDNRIRLNVLTPGQRYGGLDIVDSGSMSQATASLLWDSQNDYWFMTDATNPLVSNKMMGGPTGSFGSENDLTYGYLPRAQTGDTLENSLLTENGYTLNYNSGQFVVTASNGNTTIAGTLGVTGLTTLDQVSASNITSTSGSFGNLVIGNSSFTNITVTNLSTLNIISASNQIISGGLTVGGTATIATLSGSNGNISNNFTVNNLATVSSLSGSNGNFSNNLTVNNLATISSLSGSNGNFTNNLSINNILSAYSASITNLQIGGTAPATTNDSGITGSVRYDNDFAYVYTNGKWKRTPLSVY